MIKVDCHNCNKSGRITAFSHIKNGICFKCEGKGYTEHKAPPRNQKTFAVSFLWLDEEDPNYLNGDFCHCWNKKYPSMNKAKQAAAASMKRNGSVDFRVEVVA